MATEAKAKGQGPGAIKREAAAKEKALSERTGRRWQEAIKLLGERDPDWEAIEARLGALGLRARPALRGAAEVGAQSHRHGFWGHADSRLEAGDERLLAELCHAFGAAAASGKGAARQRGMAAWEGWGRAWVGERARIQGPDHVASEAKGAAERAGQAKRMGMPAEDLEAWGLRRARWPLSLARGELAAEGWALAREAMPSLATAKGVAEGLGWIRGAEGIDPALGELLRAEGPEAAALIEAALAKAQANAPKRRKGKAAEQKEGEALGERLAKSRWDRAAALLDEAPADWGLIRTELALAGFKAGPEPMGAEEAEERRQSIQRHGPERVERRLAWREQRLLDGLCRALGGGASSKRPFEREEATAAWAAWAGEWVRERALPAGAGAEASWPQAVERFQASEEKEPWRRLGSALDCWAIDLARGALAEPGWRLLREAMPTLATAEAVIEARRWGEEVDPALAGLLAGGDKAIELAALPELEQCLERKSMPMALRKLAGEAPPLFGFGVKGQLGFLAAQAWNEERRSHFWSGETDPSRFRAGERAVAQMMAEQAVWMLPAEEAIGALAGKEPRRIREVFHGSTEEAKARIQRRSAAEALVEFWVDKGGSLRKPKAGEPSQPKAERILEAIGKLPPEDRWVPQDILAEAGEEAARLALGGEAEAGRRAMATLGALLDAGAKVFRHDGESLRDSGAAQRSLTVCVLRGLARGTLGAQRSGLDSKWELAARRSLEAWAAFGERQDPWLKEAGLGFQHKPNRDHDEGGFATALMGRRNWSWSSGAGFDHKWVGAIGASLSRMGADLSAPDESGASFRERFGSGDRSQRKALLDWLDLQISMGPNQGGAAAAPSKGKKPRI